MNWEEIELKEISEYRTEKISTTVIETNYISTENMLPEKGGITDSSYPPTSKTVASFKTNDVLVSNIRPYFKKIWFADFDGGCSNDVIVFKSNEDNLIPKFLYYQLSKDEFFDFMMSGANGTKMPRGNRKAIPTFKLLLPPHQTQKRIVDILSAYDDLIENNLKRIKLLEQAAQNIYKEWFVNLRFPGHENTPINEETGLPLGFKEVLVNSKALYFGRGITPKYKDGSGIFGINQKVNKGSILETEHMKEFDPELNIPEKKYAHFGDVLINSLGEGTIGRVHFYSGKSVIHPVDQHMSIFRSEDLGLNLFMYLFFSSNEGQGLLASIKKGGTNMTMLNIGDLRKLEITIPNRKTLLKLQDIVLPFFKNKNLLLNQNQKLKAARDILLPRLMNRTIEV